MSIYLEWLSNSSGSFFFDGFSSGIHINNFWINAFTRPFKQDTKYLYEYTYESYCDFNKSTYTVFTINSTKALARSSGISRDFRNHLGMTYLANA